MVSTNHLVDIIKTRFDFGSRGRAAPTSLLAPIARPERRTRRRVQRLARCSTARDLNLLETAVVACVAMLVVCAFLVLCALLSREFAEYLVRLWRIRY